MKKIIIFAEEDEPKQIVMKKKLFLLLAMITLINSGYAQVVHPFRAENVYNTLKEGIATDLEHRNDMARLLSTMDTLITGKVLYWCDGRYVFTTRYDLDVKKIVSGYDYHSTKDVVPTKDVFWLNVDGGKIVEEYGDKLTVTVEQIGQYTMLVYRDTQNHPVKAFYSIEEKECKTHSWQDYIFIHYILAGNYCLENDKHSVFGPKMDFYEGSKYDHDPGIFQIEFVPETNLINVSYGKGRVSHGNPKSPKHGKMPGGGGAGAKMGPMKWQVQLTSQGLLVKIVKDQPFVDHNPRLDNKDNNVLTKVQCPWQGVDGKWAFASVLPLTHELLKLFPKDALELMCAEIYARHGAAFDDTETQNYFNAQKWYKKSKSPTELSDIEKFNAALIKQVMAGE